MKKAGLIGAVVAAAGIVFLVSLAAFVRVRGGLSPSHAGLSRAPVVGRLFSVRPEAEEPATEEELTAPTGLRGGREMTFLRLGPQARLQQLAEELDKKKSDYDAMLQGLERKARELEAWQRQLEQERDGLRAQFDQESQDLARQEEELQSKRAELDALQVAIEQAEEANLKKTAQIYGKMSPQQAARFLEQMYADGQEDTVVKLIYLMDSRAAAKTFEAFVEPQISAQITAKLKLITKSAPSGG